MPQRARSDQDKADRREALLSAALEEFYERGYTSTRMEDVARRARLSKGTVYLYFDSKEALFQALISSLTSPPLRDIAEIAAGAPSIFTALEHIADFAPKMIRQSNLPKLMKVIIGDSQLHPDIVTRYRTEVIERVLGLVTGMLESAAARGEITVDDAGLTARLIIAPIVLSGIWEALFGRDPDAAVDLERLFQTHCRLMTKALAVQGGAT